jgi:hypothetical protein
MLDLITFQGPYERRERSAATFTVKFHDQGAHDGATPTNVYYRLDDDGTGIVVADWTAVTLPEDIDDEHEVDITITPEQNRILRESCELERKTLTVMADRGLATQFVASYTFAVRNLGWLS